MNVRSAYAEAIAGLNEHRAGLIAEHDRICRRLAELDTALRVLGAMVEPETAPAFIAPRHESTTARKDVQRTDKPVDTGNADGGTHGSNPAALSPAGTQAPPVDTHSPATAPDVPEPKSPTPPEHAETAAPVSAPIPPVAPARMMRAGKPTRAAMLQAYVAEHPDPTAKEVAEHFGWSRGQVYNVAGIAGVALRRLTPDELQASRVRGGEVAGRKLAARRAEHRTTEQPDPAPAPEPETPADPEPRRPLAADIPPNDGEESRRRKYGEPEHADPEPPAEAEPEPYVHPSLKGYRAPEGAKWFRLRRDDGAWLHLSGHGFTTDRNHGWIGRIGQLRAIRANAARYPDAQGLRIVAETKPATVAA